MTAERIVWPKIVLFGDSLTQRAFEPENGLWGVLLADWLQRVCDVVVRGFSGYTSRACSIVLPRLFHPGNVSDVKVFVICLGANDSVDPESETRQHVPLAEYKKNLENMINYLTEIGLDKEKIILMTPPPYCYEQHVAFCQSTGRPTPLRDNTEVAKYAEACCEVAKTSKVDALDLFKEMSRSENWPSFLIDGLHFSSAGSQCVYTLLKPFLERRIDFRMILPSYEEMDLQNPECYLLK